MLSLSLLLACVQGMPVETTEATLRLCSAAFACPAPEPGTGLGGLGGAMNIEWSVHSPGQPRAPAAQKKGKAASARAAAAADRYEALSSFCSYPLKALAVTVSRGLMLLLLSATRTRRTRALTRVRWGGESGRRRS